MGSMWLLMQKQRAAYIRKGNRSVSILPYRSHQRSGEQNKTNFQWWVLVLMMHLNRIKRETNCQMVLSPYRERISGEHRLDLTLEWTHTLGAMLVYIVDSKHWPKMGWKEATDQLLSYLPALSKHMLVQESKRLWHTWTVTKPTSICCPMDDMCSLITLATLPHWGKNKRDGSFHLFFKG
jgi:hypothetical protein